MISTLYVLTINSCQKMKKMININIDDITRQVQHNCDISDAQHAGLYSICGLALRLRDLYKWENRLPPWVEKDSAEILDWIDARENRWEKLADMKPADLAIGDHRFTASMSSHGTPPMLTPGKVRELTHADWVCDNAEVSRALDWAPQVEFASGLRRTLAWEKAARHSTAH